MRIADLVIETHQSLAAAKVRSVLTILGIVIGIMSVVVMVSLITGFSGWLEDSMGLGSARVVTVTSSDDEHALVVDDAAFLMSADGAYEQVLVEASKTYSVDSQSSDDSTDTESGVSLQVIGVSSQYFELENVDIETGSAYEDEATAEIVLDETAVENIYGSASASVVGRSITLGADSYRIVGIAESKGGSGVMGASSLAYVSYETMSKTMLNAQNVTALLGLVNEGESVTGAAARAEGLLASRHGVAYDEDGEQSVYVASTTASALESLESYTLTFDALAALVAGIALLVGGIGIMNMMLTNVSERIREIGLRKSLGARPRDITMQFLAESVALCLTGGVVGIVAGYAGAWGLAAVLARVDSSFAGLAPVITPGLVAVVFAVCAGIGIVFGYYPARRAAKLNPAETLRYQ